ncbi:hypothetical protein Tco_0971880 [Tanacetum coccineum]
MHVVVNWKVRLKRKDYLEDYMSRLGLLDFRASSVDYFFAHRYLRFMAAPVISISSYSSGESVESSISRVILFGTIHTDIPTTVHTIVPPVVHDDIPVIPNETPIIPPAAPEAKAATC